LNHTRLRQEDRPPDFHNPARPFLQSLVFFPRVGLVLVRGTRIVPAVTRP